MRSTSAQQAVEGGGDEGVESRLATLQTDGKMGIAAIAKTAGELYSDLLEQGAAFAPALITAQQDGASLVDGGYAIFKGDRLVGFLEGMGARGMELLANQPAAELIEVALPEKRVTVRITGATTSSKLESQGNGLVLNCRVTAQLIE